MFLSDLTPFAPLGSELQRCRWFTRGWTLQELIAPKNIDFFDRNWSYRGNKIDFIDDLARITGINIGVLQHTQPLSMVAIAQKMSWASQRQTTRIEDAAYCLLGLFDVNMALLYGEEEKAFQRLQEEIIRTTPDYSIFAWITPLAAKNAQNPEIRIFSGVFASSPLQFSKCGSFMMLDQTDNTRSDFSVSNQGIKMHSRPRLEQILGEQGFRYTFPVCSSKAKTTLGIRLRRCGPSQFLREDPFTLIILTDTVWEDVARSRYLLTQLQDSQSTFPSQLSPGDSIILQSRPYVLQIRLPPKMKIDAIWPWARWDDEDQIFFLSGDSGRDCGAAVITNNSNFPVSFQFILYAIGWAKHQIRPMKCTVVDNKLLNPAVRKELMELLEPKDCHISEVERHLADYDIPQSSSVIIDVGLLKRSVLVYFTTTKVTNPAICQNAFWRVDFGWKFCDNKKLPKIHDAKWGSNG